MQTRSKLNLKNISHIQFYESIPDPREILYGPKKDLNTEDLNSQEYTETFKVERTTRTIIRSLEYPTQHTIGNVLIFDTETFEMIGEWYPYQISWGVYRWNESTKMLDLLHHEMYHTSEYIHLNKYRSYLSEKMLKLHTLRGLNEMSAVNIVKRLDETISEFNVNTIAAFNISYDFEKVRKLIKFARAISNKNNEELTLKNIEYNHYITNPFRHPRLKYLDLMHVCGCSYVDKLIEMGINDGYIWNNIDTKQLKLTKIKGKKGVYSAEYMLNKFFGVKQTHFADDDVKHESLLLEKILQDFGEHNIDYNVCYIDSMYNLFKKRVNSSKHDIPWESPYSPKHQPSSESEDLTRKQLSIHHYSKNDSSNKKSKFVKSNLPSKQTKITKKVTFKINT
jgi:hypothetical protein